jgi:hypothetical protein
MRSRCCCYGEASSSKKSTELGALRQAERSKEGRISFLLAHFCWASFVLNLCSQLTEDS